MPTWHTFHGTHGWEVDGTGTRVPRYRLTGDHPLSQRRFGAARRRSAQRMLIYVQLPAVDHTKPAGPERLLLPLEQLGFALGAIGRVSVGAETKCHWKWPVDALLKAVPLAHVNDALKSVVVLHQVLAAWSIAVKPRHRAAPIWHHRCRRIIHPCTGIALARQLAQLSLACTHE